MLRDDPVYFDSCTIDYFFCDEKMGIVSVASFFRQSGKKGLSLCKKKCNWIYFMFRFFFHADNSHFNSGPIVRFERGCRNKWAGQQLRLKLGPYALAVEDGERRARISD